MNEAFGKHRNSGFSGVRQPSSSRDSKQKTQSKNTSTQKNRSTKEKLTTYMSQLGQKLERSIIFLALLLRPLSASASTT